MLFFRRFISSVVALLLALPSMLNVCFFGTENINTNSYGQVRPDTWAAVDGLGRSLPVYAEIFQWLPFPLGIMGYVLFFTLGAYAVLSVAEFLTHFFLKKKKPRDILNVT